jgi:hypothetical protein
LFSLPTARNEWQCGQTWVNGELIIDPDKGCGQWIYESDEKFESGKNMIKNSRDGPGGLRDMKHKCPNRVGSIFHKADNFFSKLEYRYHQQYFTCSICAQTFNKEMCPLCPTCFKMECRKCGNLQTWIAGQGIECFNCGGKCDVRQVFFSYERLYGKQI